MPEKGNQNGTHRRFVTKLDISPLETSMAHPVTRAERRNVRRMAIRSALSKTLFLHLFNRHCSCWPHGYRFHVGCDLHDPRDPRKVGRYAKNPPRNWLNDMEPEWAYGGVIRRDYRAGGGRRGDEWGCKRRWYAGRFRLPIALQEWEDNADDDDELHPE